MAFFTIFFLERALVLDLDAGSNPAGTDRDATQWPWLDKPISPGANLKDLLKSPIKHIRQSISSSKILGGSSSLKSTPSIEYDSFTDE